MFVKRVFFISMLFLNILLYDVVFSLSFIKLIFYFLNYYLNKNLSVLRAILVVHYFGLTIKLIIFKKFVANVFVKKTTFVFFRSTCFLCDYMVSIFDWFYHINFLIKN